MNSVDRKQPGKYTLAIMLMGAVCVSSLVAFWVGIGFPNNWLTEKTEWLRIEPFSPQTLTVGFIAPILVVGILGVALNRFLYKLSNQRTAYALRKALFITLSFMIVATIIWCLMVIGPTLFV